MDRVFGPEELIDRVKKAVPGDPTIYVNLDAILEMMPDQYEAHLGEVKFDPKTDWDDVGNGNFMPQPQIYSEIAIKRGVECSPEEHCEVIKDDININPMLCKGLEEEPTIRRMDVGYWATKRGAVMIEDGTYLPSDVCRDSYNAWERCTAMWAKEEMYTEGYSKKGKFPPKYDTTWKRRKHFAEEMLYAQRKSDTKARHIVIRHLASLKTGYKQSDIESGSFVFVRIQKSRESIKLEQIARLEALRRGLAPLPDNRAGQKLFGPAAPEPGLAIHEAVDPEPPPFGDVPWPEPDDKALTLLDVLQAYYDKGLVAEDLKANTKTGIDYIAKTPAFGPDDPLWGNAVAMLARIESTLENDKLIEHEKWGAE